MSLPARPPRVPRLLLVLLVLPGLALLAGCNPDEDDLVGVWRGANDAAAYTFELGATGEGRISVVTGGRQIGYTCKWSVSDNRLWLRQGDGTVANFRILDQDDDELVVRVANGRGGLCRLARVPGEGAAAGQ